MRLKMHTKFLMLMMKDKQKDYVKLNEYEYFGRDCMNYFVLFSNSFFLSLDSQFLNFPFNSNWHQKNTHNAYRIVLETLCQQNSFDFCFDFESLLFLSTKRVLFSKKFR